MKTSENYIVEKGCQNSHEVMFSWRTEHGICIAFGSTLLLVIQRVVLLSGPLHKDPHGTRALTQLMHGFLKIGSVNRDLQLSEASILRHLQACLTEATQSQR